MNFKLVLSISLDSCMSIKSNTCNNMEALAHSTELVTDGNPLLL